MSIGIIDIFEVIYISLLVTLFHLK